MTLLDTKRVLEAELEYFNKRIIEIASMCDEQIQITTEHHFRYKDLGVDVQSSPVYFYVGPYVNAASGATYGRSTK